MRKWDIDVRTFLNNTVYTHTHTHTYVCVYIYVYPRGIHLNYNIIN